MERDKSNAVHYGNGKYLPYGLPKESFNDDDDDDTVRMDRDKESGIKDFTKITGKG